MYIENQEICPENVSVTGDAGRSSFRPRATLILLLGRRILKASPASSHNTRKASTSKHRYGGDGHSQGAPRHYVGRYPKSYAPQTH